MPKRDHDIYASAALRDLLAEEMAVLMPVLQRCAGTRGLLLTADTADGPPVLPLLGCWTRLEVAGDGIRGDLRADPREPLPFVDEAFDLILLRHALEALPCAPDLLDEAVRCLVPGGLLVVSGVHPLSGWWPWWRWRTRGASGHLHAPWQLEGWLRHDEVRVERIQRVGKPWPGRPSDARGRAHPLGGGYLMLVRKQSSLRTPVRLRPRPLAAPSRAGLVHGARRHSTT